VPDRGEHAVRGADNTAGSGPAVHVAWPTGEGRSGTWQGATSRCLGVLSALGWRGLRKAQAARTPRQWYVAFRQQKVSLCPSLTAIFPRF
jgi:hypothetical protein